MSGFSEIISILNPKTGDPVIDLMPVCTNPPFALEYSPFTFAQAFSMMDAQSTGLS